MGLKWKFLVLHVLYLNSIRERSRVGHAPLGIDMIADVFPAWIPLRNDGDHLPGCGLDSPLAHHVLLALQSFHVCPSLRTDSRVQAPIGNEVRPPSSISTPTMLPRTRICVTMPDRSPAKKNLRPMRSFVLVLPVKALLVIFYPSPTVQ